MPRILIVEDDSFKVENLAAFLTGHLVDSEIDFVSCVASAVRIVQQEEFDLIILDMALPSHPVVSGGGAPMSLLTGGLEILFELQSLGRHDPCIIVTQYPEIEITGLFFSVESAAKAIKACFSCDVIGCVQYSEESSDWKLELAALLKDL
jgi:CheY-like chemotaxis protein